MLSDAHIDVTCNGCHQVEEIPLTATAGHGCWDERDVAAHLGDLGWLVIDDDTHYCEECRELHEEETDDD